MKKNSVKMLIRTLCAAVALVGAAGVFALENGGTASAAQAPADTLVAPTSYEQYLDLEAPTDVAACERYTAIADGNRIYVYDKSNEEYRKYEHPEANIVKKVQFSDSGKLYFAVQRASGDNFYEVALNTYPYQASEIDNIACSTFVIDGETLYFANSTGLLYTYDLRTPTVAPVELQQTSTSQKDSLSFENGELYYLNDYRYLTKINVQTPDETIFYAAFPNVNLKSFAVAGNTFACTTENKEFFAYSLSELFSAKDATTIEPLAYATGEYTTISDYGGYVYAVNGDKIEQYSVEGQAFTDHSICSASSAPNRLNGATDICLSKDRLFIADAGNARVSVYDTQSGAFTNNFPIGLSAQYISSDGETVLLASATQIAVYAINGEQQAFFEGFQSEIKGVASVYGKHYLISNGYAYCIAKDTESGEWKLSAVEKRPSRFASPKLFTSDVYGNLYFTAQTSLYRISETELMRSDGEGEEICISLPAGAEKIAVDHEGNFYALADGNVYKNGDGEYVSFNADPLVYAPDGVNATAFAFGAEENEAYVLCDGNYLIGSPRLELPTVKTIAVNGADEEIFSEASAEFTVVETRENALLVAFDLEKLEGAEHFPYLYYERSAEAKTALRLGTAGAYSILAYYDRDSSAYRTYLTLTSFVGEAEDGSASFETPKTGYITSAVTLYKFPYLTKLLVAGELPRGCEVQVLGELSIDHDYYQVSYVENGKTKTGYIPRSYVSETDGLIPEAQTVVYGAEESNRDALWRLAYILLGLAAIAILTDYLLLRKKKE